MPARRARVRVERTWRRARLCAAAREAPALSSRTLKRPPHAHERSHSGDASARASASAMVTARATVS